LLIDDDPTQTELTILNLERSHWGFEFVVVQTPKEALRSLKEQSFDCVVSDYMMPDIGAIKPCKNIKSFLNVPFILYTGIESEEVAENAFNAGVDDYIRK
jgi:CheY-like chemotaxis protein